MLACAQESALGDEEEQVVALLLSKGAAESALADEMGRLRVQEEVCIDIYMWYSIRPGWASGLILPAHSACNRSCKGVAGASMCLREHSNCQVYFCIMTNVQHCPGTDTLCVIFGSLHVH